MPEAGDADVAAWVERLALQEAPSPEDGQRTAGAARPDAGAAADRLAEKLGAWRPGVSTVGAQRLLEHFRSLRARGRHAGAG